MSEFTKGRWYHGDVEPYCDTYIWSDIDNEESVLVATVEWQEVTVAESEENARLIAAAPLLLKELESLVCLMEPLETEGRLSVPGLATLNGPRAALAVAVAVGKEES